MIFIEGIGNSPDEVYGINWYYTKDYRANLKHLDSYYDYDEEDIPHFEYTRRDDEEDFKNFKKIVKEYGTKYKRGLGRSGYLVYIKVT